MKRSVIFVLALALVAGSFAAPAMAKKKKKKAPVRIEQVVEIAYQGGNAGVSTPGPTGGTCFVDPSMPFSCKSAIPESIDFKYVQVEVVDDSGQKAGGFISQGDTDGDTVADGYGQFCGGHPEPIEMTAPGNTVDISLYAGVCSDASGPSVVTSGVITVTFSNLP